MSGQPEPVSHGDTGAWTASGLDRRSSVPLYYQLQEILHQQIASGRFRVGDPLPSEGELCRMFDVSRIVVRQALGMGDRVPELYGILTQRFGTELDPRTNRFS